MADIFANYKTMDPFILFSSLNLKLRDEFSTLDDLCATYDIDKQALCERLATIGYSYNAEQNQFKNC